MRTPILALSLMLAAAPAVAYAQMEHEHGGQSLGTAAILPLYNTFKGYLIASAEQVSEADYAFKPTPAVRSFGQLMGHVANANFMFCANAVGEANPRQGKNAETLPTKAEIVQAVKDAFAYCDKAYQMPEAKLAEQVSLFGMQGSRLWVLNFNAMHDAEHYGNAVTYLRLKGMTPPSSQGGM
jgi:uncharacterized damage-inducible protein DinB